MIRGLHAESGQAAVETALTMPLALFMVLGTLQLFMLLQGRLFAEHAAYSAARVGVVRHGDCTAMTHAAIAALLPSFTSYLGEATAGSSPSEKLATAFALRTRNKPFDNQYDPAADDPHSGAVVWIFRPSPRVGQVRAQSEDDFDDPDTAGYRLELKVVYWYPLRIPFANWVMATMYRAYFGLGDYTEADFLGEAAGTVHPADQWDVRTNYTVQFGQGMTATAIQMASVYQSLGNDGVRVPVKLTDGCEWPDGTVTDTPAGQTRQVVSQSAAQQTVNMMEMVALHSYSSDDLTIPGYRVAAKSGTAEVAENGVYGNQSIISYVGLAPADGSKPVTSPR